MGAPVPEPSSLIYVWRNDFLVGLALELSQNEHIPVVFWKLGDALLNDLPQMTLTIHVIWTGRRVFELERTIVIFEVLLDRLKEDQRVTRAVTQLILRQIRGNRIDPGRKLLRAVKAMQVAIDTNENLLHQIFRLFPVPNCAVYEVQETRLVPRDQFRERALLSTKE